MSKTSVYQQTDEMVTRNRFTRLLVAILSPILAVFIGWLGGLSLAAFFHLPAFLGGTIGFVLGGLAAAWVVSRSFITNAPVTGAFVTVDALKALFSEESHVTYGPGGPHLCFWWEQREDTGNVDLSEVKEDLKTEVLGPSGTFFVEYSVRLRPDIRHLPEFISGIASAAGGIDGIISAVIASFLADKNANEAAGLIKELNTTLKVTFEEGELGEEISKFEKRFGVIVGDITVDKLLPSNEVQKALDGASEAQALQKIVCQSLGYPDMAAVYKAIEVKEITQDQLARATENAMVITDNLHGMNLGRQSYDIRLHGNPELVEALKIIAPHAAPIAQAIRGAQNNPGKPGKGGKK